MTELKLRIIHHTQDTSPEDTFSVGGYEKGKGGRRVKRVQRIISGIMVIATHDPHKKDPATIEFTGPFAEILTVEPGDYGSRLVSRDPPISLDFNHEIDSPVLHPRRRI